MLNMDPVEAEFDRMICDAANRLIDLKLGGGTGDSLEEEARQIQASNSFSNDLEYIESQIENLVEMMTDE